MATCKAFPRAKHVQSDLGLREDPHMQDAWVLRGSVSITQDPTAAELVTQNSSFSALIQSAFISIIMTKCVLRVHEET